MLRRALHECFSVRCIALTTLSNRGGRSASSSFSGETAAFQSVVSSAPALVQFYTTWCAPCKKIAGDYEALSEQHQAVKFLNVNVEECEEVSALHDIRSIPTFLGFREGHLVGRVEGAQVEELVKLLAELEDQRPLPPPSHRRDPLE